jgi:hypothetical protein
LGWCVFNIAMYSFMFYMRTWALCMIIYFGRRILQISIRYIFTSDGFMLKLFLVPRVKHSLVVLLSYVELFLVFFIEVPVLWFCA